MSITCRIKNEKWIYTFNTTVPDMVSCRMGVNQLEIKFDLCFTVVHISKWILPSLILPVKYSFSTHCFVLFIGGCISLGRRFLFFYFFTSTLIFVFLDIRAYMFYTKCCIMITPICRHLWRWLLGFPNTYLIGIQCNDNL